jgi:hypothetical protein
VQQQEKEHQQATQKNYNDAQKQQMEQRQAPRQTAPKPESRPPAEKPH